ncbi:MAG: MFS transporter [Promethearchaeota archaeon]|nr:MAG: MFS transporter [Candidatus Lokiarchaeota archaeon]
MGNLTEKITRRTKLAFATGEIGDNLAYQSFSFLVFTFYFTLVKLDVLWITAGFIIWSVWNSINDPLLGWLSDRTKGKLGRRIPWMIVGTIPLALIMILMFTPPLASSNEVKFLYFLLMLFIFDFAYTSFNINYNAMFSEMFVSMEERSKVGQLRIIFVIIGVIIGFVVPTFIIEDLTNIHEYSYTQSQFFTNGVIAAIIILLAYFVVLKWGVRVPSEFSQDAKNVPSFMASIKFTLHNKAFLIYMIPALGTWIVIGILPAVIPLWATHVLNITEENSIQTGILLLVTFLVSGLSTPIWVKIRQRWGARIAGLAGVGTWILTILSFLFAYDFPTALITMILNGLGLGGSLYFYDQCLAEIIDEDEITHGVRRSGGYYGMINFIIRLSGVINFLMIGIVFSGSDWETYTPDPGVDTLAGIQFLLSWFPFIVLVLSFIGLWFYPIKGERLAENRKRLTELHDKKRAEEV